MNHQTFLSPSLLALLVCLGALLVSRTLADGKECKKPDGSTSSCVCQTDNGIIDLTPLSGKGGKPRFTGVKDTEGLYEYDYNPCNTFHDETYSKKCTNVYICQGGVKDKSLQYIVGDQEEQIKQDGQKYYVHYTTMDDDTREGKVNLNCDQGTEGKITSVTQDTNSKPTIYTFELHSCHACPGGCKSGVSSGYIGLIIIVLVLVAIVTYFIAGAVLMKVRYEATGSDIVPNKGFWIQLPLLIKDGCVFTVSPCINLIRSRRNDYQKI